MTPEDKELLLKDLCARLPYGVKVEHLLHAPNNPSDLFAIDVYKQILYCDHKGHEEWYKVEFVKPYLRPMSSMAEEEKEEMHNLLSPEGTAIYKNDGIALPINHYGEYVTYEFMNRIIQYLLENHFDFMGLIPKGLAIEVNESNNPY